MVPTMWLEIIVSLAGLYKSNILCLLPRRRRTRLILWLTAQIFSRVEFHEGGIDKRSVHDVVSGGGST